MHEVLVNRLGGLTLPRKSVVRLTDRPDMTSDVYRGRKITTTIFPVDLTASKRTHDFSSFVCEFIGYRFPSSFFFRST